METRDQLYIGGQWHEPSGKGALDVLEAATEEVIGSVPAGDSADVDAAVGAARGAFDSWSQSSVGDRAAMLRGLADGLAAQSDSLAEIMSREVGTPISASGRVQVDQSLAVLRSMADLIEEYPLTEQRGNARIVKVAAGVVGAITPWNYPLYQIAAKLGPAIAAGCTTVVKPSSVAPLAAFRLADVAHEIGLPAGVLNIVTGPGVQVGEDLASHPDVDVVSLTGSVRAGARVGELAAGGIKRVTLELGGKSAFILTDDADVEAGVTALLANCFSNNGQTCSATTRLVVARSLLDQVEDLLTERVAALVVGDPLDPATNIGPVASAGQRASIQADLEKGSGDGVVLVGGAGPVEGLDRGYFVRPTVISRLSNSAHLAREEIFGPVLVVVPVDDDDEAVAVANDSDYGLGGAVFSGDDDRAVSIAMRLRTGRVSVNGGKSSVLSPFGGFRKSGVGRELGEHGLSEYFELMALHLPARG